MNPLKALPARFSFISAALWFSILFMPFKGVKAAFILFAVLSVSIPLLKFIFRSASGLDFFGRLSGRLESLDGRYAWLLLVPAALIPLLSRNYVTDVAVICGIYIILALGLNVVVGFTGLLNLGFAAFYAIGAYGYALMNTRLGLGFWTALPISVLVAAAAGVLLAVPAVRLKGDYLALVTLGFGEIVRLVLNNWDSFTRGPNGISGIEPPYIFGTPLGNISSFYYLVLFMVAIVIFITVRIRDSRIGRAWMAIREDETAATAMGINPVYYKLYACGYGAFLAGAAGCLFAAKMRFVSPESFTFMESVFILCMVIIGGLGSVAGAVAGAVVLVALPEVMRDVQTYRMLAVGIGLVFLMIFRPQGLFGRKIASSGG